MKSTFHLLHGIGKTLICYLIIWTFLILTSILIVHVESYIFALIKYKWTGVSDIRYWFLGLIELLLGVWLFMSSRRGPGKWSFIGSGLEDTMSIIRVSAAGGIFLGLGFSGFWKVLLMLGYLAIGFKQPL